MPQPSLPVSGTVLTLVSRRDARTRMMRQWRTASDSQSGQLWLAGYEKSPHWVWGERAYALASYGDSHGFYGSLPASLVSNTPQAPAQPPSAEDGCPVCLDEYSDVWPSTDPQARCPPRRWACNHMVCIDCDLRIQFSPVNTKCPICRAPRA